MNQRPVDDTQLRLKCIAGDRDAADEFVRRFSDLVYRTIQYTLRNRQAPFTPEDLQDVHNTVFLNFFENDCRKMAQFEGRNGCSLATWVRLVAMRIVLNLLRKRGLDGISGRRQIVAVDLLAEIRSDQPDALSVMEKANQLEVLKQGIQALPAKYRLFFRLHIEHELPPQEIARAMGITIDNVYTVKHRALKKLKDIVGRASEL